MTIFLYILAIALANVLTAAIEPFRLGLFIIPTGSALIRATFILRDFVQRGYGRWLMAGKIMYKSKSYRNNKILNIR